MAIDAISPAGGDREHDKFTAVGSKSAVRVSSSFGTDDKEYLNEFLKSGDAINANGDYSGGDAEFQYLAPIGSVYEITRLIVNIADANINSYSSYGGVGPLISGVKLFVVQNDTESELTKDDSVKTNGSWASYCFDSQILESTSGSDFMAVRWTFSRAGANILLAGSPDRVYVKLGDDLSGLNNHTFQIQGYRRK